MSPFVRVVDHEDAVGDLARQADARGAHLDDAGLAGLAERQLAFTGETEGAQQVARRGIELRAAKADDGSGAD